MIRLGGFHCGLAAPSAGALRSSGTSGSYDECDGCQSSADRHSQGPRTLGESALSGPSLSWCLTPASVGLGARYRDAAGVAPGCGELPQENIIHGRAEPAEAT